MKSRLDRAPGSSGHSSAHNANTATTAHRARLDEALLRWFDCGVIFAAPLFRADADAASEPVGPTAIPTTEIVRILKLKNHFVN